MAQLAIHAPSSSQQTDRTDSQEDDLIVDFIPETQNIDQSLSQSTDDIAILATMPKGRVDHLHFTSTFSTPCIHEGGSPLAKMDWLGAILKHIGLTEEDELEVFVDALDDEFVPTSLTPPSSTSDKALNHYITQRLWKV